ncbi:MAG: OmpA family protein [Bacteroidota bacterium]|nr:OmpA family protein [Bacteroidota bacterium]
MGSIKSFGRIFFVVFLSASTISCVSKKIYTGLEDKHNELLAEKNAVERYNTELEQQRNQLELDNSILKDELDKLKKQNFTLESEYQSANKNIKDLRSAYNSLENRSLTSLRENSDKNRELLAQLEAKERSLQSEQARLEKLKKELNERSRRVNELESFIATNERDMKKLKEKLSSVLYNFEDKGLTVEQKEGKVYVSMENKLLFASGSWEVAAEGRKAIIEVGKVLADNPEIVVLIEGHTDNAPYSGQGQIKDNWDLSTKRATSIVRILRENKGINPLNLTAAGRSEFAPIASNETTEGKSKNRRIEIILTPRLDEISKMLDEL